MIDPNIALAFRNPEIQDPIDVQARQANLKSIANAQQLQQQQIADNKISAQQRALELQGQQRTQQAQGALNTALQANTTKDPLTGAPIVDYDKVAGAMTDAGFGKEGLAFKQNVNALRESDARLTELTDTITADKHEHAARLVGTVLDAPEAIRPLAYKGFLDASIGAGYLHKGELPDQYSPDVDGKLRTLQQGAQSVSEQIRGRQQAATNAISQQKADADTARADAQNKRAEALDQLAINKEDQGRYTATGDFDSQRHPIVLDKKTGKLSVDTSVTGSAESVGAKSGAGRQLTPDAALANQSKNQTDYEKNGSAELKARQERDALDQAIAKGNVYVNAKGEVQPFSSMKTATNEQLGQDDIDAMKLQMRQRRQVAETAVEQAVANKNNAMQRNGVRPAVSTQEAIAGYRGQGSPQATPASPQTGRATAAGAQPPAAIVSKMQAGKVTTFNNGQKWMKNADGTVKQVS